MNNAFDASNSLPGSVGGSLNWSVGNGPDYSSELFTGDIGAHLVYNRALTADERGLVANRLADDFTILGVPEPGVVTLLGLGGIGLLRRRRG